MHFNTSLPPVSLGTELFSNYRQEKGSFPREGDAKAGSRQEHAERGAGSVGWAGAVPGLRAALGAAAGPGLYRATAWRAAGSNGGFAFLKAGFSSRRKGKEEG